VYGKSVVIFSRKFGEYLKKLKNNTLLSYVKRTFSPRIKKAVLNISTLAVADRNP
jgi:hypothetical protein